MARSTKSDARQTRSTRARQDAQEDNGENWGRDASGGGKIAKTQIAQLVADRTSLSKRQAGEAVASVVGAPREGRSVSLPGLGTLSVTQTAARQGGRPGTNERITIPGGRKIRFKVATTLKATL